jgi:RNA polymerase sigma-70 factor (ECF subfamily)
MALRSIDIVLRHLRRLAGPSGAELTDRQLLRSFAAERDEVAFSELVRRHGPMVWGVARGLLGNTPDAEDCFQATFLVLVRKAAVTRWDTSVAHWLYEVARRIAWRMRTQANRRRLHEARAAQAAREAAVADEGWPELCAALDEELRRLPRRYREPLLLCYWQGETRDRASRRLGLSLRTFDRRLAGGASGCAAGWPPAG